MNKLKLRKRGALLFTVLLALSFLTLFNNTPPAKADEYYGEGIIDSYSENNKDADVYIADLHPSDSAYTSAVGQVFTTPTDYVCRVTKAVFYLKKGEGSPSGNSHAVLYAKNDSYNIPVGSPLAVSELHNVSQFGSSYQLIEFAFNSSQQYITALDTSYVIVFEGPINGTINPTNNLKVGYDTSAPMHSGSYCSFKNGAWSWTSYDLVFYVYAVKSSEIAQVTWSKAIRWQQKQFFSDGLYWAFYVNGTDNPNAYAYYKVSSDGINWVNQTLLYQTTYLYGESLAVFFTGIYVHIVIKGPSAAHLYYRRGNPISNGSIVWDTDWQNIWNTGGGITDHYLSVDSAGYPYVTWCYGSETDPRPYVSKSVYNNGTWSPASGYPMLLADEQIWTASIFALSNRRMYVFLFNAYFPFVVKGRLWNGDVWKPLETDIIGGSSIHSEYYGETWSFSAVVDSSDNIHFVWLTASEYVQYNKRTMSSGWGDISTLSSLLWKYATPQITLDPNNGELYCFWTNDNHIFYRVYSGSWSTPVDWIDESAETLAHDDNGGYSGCINAFKNNPDGYITIMYVTNASALYRLKFARLPTLRYRFFGVYDESTGTLKDASQRAVNVTAHFIGQTSETFEVNGSYVYTPSILPQFFVFELPETYRDYWVSPGETSAIIYIFEAPTTVYTLEFIDLANILDDYCFVSAKRYVNGTLHIIEKRKVDAEKKVYMSLINGVKYIITIQDGTSYEYGDLLMTYETTISLTLKGIDFPKNIILAYRYVRLYAERHNNSTSISMLYQDLDENTDHVVCNVKYRNGTVAYTSTQYSDSFNVTWTSALYALTYVVEMNAYHNDYGLLTYRVTLQRGGFGQTWELGWLGSIPDFKTADLIPLLLIFGVAALFSKVNAPLAALLATGMAMFLVWLGWISIAPGYLATALFLSIFMGLAYKKYREIGT